MRNRQTRCAGETHSHRAYAITPWKVGTQCRRMTVAVDKRASTLAGGNESSPKTKRCKSLEIPGLAGPSQGSDDALATSGTVPAAMTISRDSRGIKVTPPEVLISRCASPRRREGVLQQSFGQSWTVQECKIPVAAAQMVLISC